MEENPQEQASLEPPQKAPKTLHTLPIIIGIIGIVAVFILNIDVFRIAFSKIFPQITNPPVKEETSFHVVADPAKAKRKGIEKCGRIPDIPSIPQGHFDVVDGPFWLLDCQHLVWNQWTSGTSWIGEDDSGDNPTHTPLDKFKDGIYVLNSTSMKSSRVSGPGAIVTIEADQFTYIIEETTYAQRISDLEFTIDASINPTQPNQPKSNIYTDPANTYSFTFPEAVVIDDVDNSQLPSIRINDTIQVLYSHQIYDASTCSGDCAYWDAIRSEKKIGPHEVVIVRSAGGLPGDPQIMRHEYYIFDPNNSQYLVFIVFAATFEEQSKLNYGDPPVEAYQTVSQDKINLVENIISSLEFK